MSPSMTELAEAFSRHRFDEVYPYLAEGVRWHVMGDRTIVGRAEVIATCEESAAFLATSTTDFGRFRIIAGTDGVVIDSRAKYLDAEGNAFTIASCDVYEFTGGALTEITSYTVELA